MVVPLNTQLNLNTNMRDFRKESSYTDFIHSLVMGRS
ncbi:protein of unknown function [Magnetospirillum sp. XM-1]|nr:protein of unknown function [Magnetospirillum sp. XM-1]